MFRSVKTIAVYFLIVLALSIIGIYVYTRFKTEYIVYNTTHSEHWESLVADFKKNPAEQNSIIFLGDSHIEHFDFGSSVFPGIVNRGITGDFTAGVLLRLDEIIRSEPGKIFIEVGTNDVIEKVSESEICKNYEQIVSRLAKEAPHAEIYIQSILPVCVEGSYFTSNENVNNRIISVNGKLKELAAKYHCVYINLYDKLSENNSLRKDLNSDAVHLNKKGYSIWMEEISLFLQ